MVKVASLGAAALDTIVKVDEFPHNDEIVFPKSIDMCPGGSTANVAVGLKRLGIESTFWGKVGDDKEGKIIIQEFLKEGVNTENIIKEKSKRSAGAFIAVNSSGERVIYSLGGTALYEKIEEVKYINLDDIQGIYIGEAFPEIAAEIEEKARDKNITIFYSPGGLFCRYGLNYLIKIIKNCDYILLNLPEAKILTGCSDKNMAVEKLLNLGIKAVVITEGKLGSGYYSRETNIFKEAYKVNAIDTTGAGDSFTAGFIKGVLSNYKIGKCLEFGNACASIAIKKIGARASMPYYDEVVNYIGQKF